MLTQKQNAKGQSLVEYGLVLALIAVVAILVVKSIGTKTTSVFDNTQQQISNNNVPSTAPTAASS